MKNLSIILAFALVALMSCTKSKEVHPEIGDGNDEIITVGMKDVHVEYMPADISGLSKVVFHYCPAGANGNAQQFAAAEMTKKETLFELTLNDLLKDTLYWYYYELNPNSGDAFNTPQKTFHTQAFDEPEPPVAELPTVTTAEVSEITSNSAQCGGDVINDGGATVTEFGICWSTNANPTLDDSHVAVGAGIGHFFASMTNLEANTTYHVRAYATNEVGIAYGQDVEFTTLAAAGSVPIGAIDGLFTINANGDQVYFSKGNLQYQASTNIWRFAEHQWDFVGDYEKGNVYENGVKCDNSLISASYSGWIDLFGWGTSGWDNGNLYYQPYDYEYYDVVFCGLGYGPTDGVNYDIDITGLYANSDWGRYNPILNGGNTAGVWRTLTFDEWLYIFSTRNTPSNIRYAGAQVNGVLGLLLLPDDWIPSLYSLTYCNMVPGTSPWDYNVVTLTDWENNLEPNGVIFLPAAGSRYMTNVGVGYGGLYWTASSSLIATTVCSWCVNILSSGCVSREFRRDGCSVRLVQDANP